MDYNLVRVYVPSLGGPPQYLRSKLDGARVFVGILDKNGVVYLAGGGSGTLRANGGPPGTPLEITVTW